MTTVRQRGVTVRPFPSSRRLVTAAVRAGRRIVPMHGLFDVDITAARRQLDQHHPPLSLTAFVVASVGQVAASHPQVHAYRDWRGRLVEHRHVDVQTLIEVPTDQGAFGLVHIIRDADIRSVTDISDELRAVKGNPTSTATGHLLSTLAPALGRIPGLCSVMYAVMSRSRRIHAETGTVQVTAVGMFAGGGGFGIAPPTLASLVVVIGGLSKRPRAMDDRIEIRDVLDLTVTIDHNIVDGAPATRFGADLRQNMQTAAVLGPSVPEGAGDSTVSRVSQSRAVDLDFQTADHESSTTAKTSTPMRTPEPSSQSRSNIRVESASLTPPSPSNRLFIAERG